MKIAFIGGGNMGEAMLSAVLGQKLTAPDGICVSDVSESRREYLNKQYGIAVTADNREAVKGKNIVVLAVKPQNLPEVMADLKGCLESTLLVLSIVAGMKISAIARGLGHARVVRCMPNTPAQVGFGMSGWTATAGVSEEQKGQARAILGSMGKEIYFDDEKYLDMVTAVSASGPAYVFLLAESLIDAAVKIGLSRKEAGELVSQMTLGSAHLMQQSARSPAELRRNVTSRGGTTERALQVFEEGGFAKIVEDAVKAAYRRAKELGNR
ncbi:MAG: pyrroline-5-carboxylate reductase [Dehalococcoidales bacterium]|nr:pyrroline-5-carboxylate reductase [Dehalococcoidales bacterium]